MKRLIVTGDDFGLSLPVNEAIETAHTQGILTTTCLMVSGPAAEDAVERAKRLPDLGVGLHIVVTRGTSILPPGEIPDLVDENGRFDNNLARAGVRYFFSQRLRRQLAAEIQAQFEAFQATGLTLDHVNAHNHMHLHPTIFGLVMEIGERYSLRAVRVPLEPRCPVVLRCRPEWMKARLRRRSLHFNDTAFGLLHSGRMDREQVLASLSQLPEGTTEMFFHPATRNWEMDDKAAKSYRFQDELAALLDKGVRDEIDRGGTALATFRDLD